MKNQNVDEKICQIREKLHRSIEIFHLASMIQVGSILVICLRLLVPNYLNDVPRFELVASAIVLILASRLADYCIRLRRKVDVYLHFTDGMNTGSIPDWLSQYCITTLVVTACSLSTNELLAKVGLILFGTAFCLDFIPAIWKYEGYKTIIEMQTDNNVEVQSANNPEDIKEA